MREVILHGATIWTGELGESGPEALLIRDGRIQQAAGLDDCRRTAPAAVLHDVGGGLLMPGFNDNHLHTAAYGRQQGVLKLRGLNTAQIISALQERYSSVAAGVEIQAAGWDYDMVEDPQAVLLDAAFPDNPVVLIQFSGHAAWVNSLVLRQLGIDRDTPDPPGGVIVRDAAGLPTGVVRDAAVEPLQRRIFLKQHLDRRRLRRDLRAAVGQYAAMGMTSVQDNTWLPQAVWELQRLRRRGELSARFSCWPHAGFPKLRFVMERLTRYHRDRVELGPRKYFLDGTFSTRTAWLLEPYLGETDQCGTPVMTASQLEAALRSAARARRQCAFHAIGDRAVHEFLRVFEAVAGEYPVLRSLRIRLEHGQMISREDIPRLRDAGVLIAAQPHAAGSFAKDIRLIGERRARDAYPYRALLDGGVPLSFGSDIPGEATVHPLYGIQLAVQHPGDQGITAEEAMQAYTAGSAYAQFAEAKKGRLLPGMFADVVHLSDDPRRVAPGQIAGIAVRGTMLGGQWVYRAQETAD